MNFSLINNKEKVTTKWPLHIIEPSKSHTRIDNKKIERYKKKIYILGLLPFLFIALNYQSLISLLIFIIGYLFHSRFIDKTFGRYLDLSINIFIILYFINNKSYNCFLLSIISFTCIFYIYNNYYYRKDNPIKSALFHVLFVQWTTAFCLFYIYHYKLNI